MRNVKLAATAAFLLVPGLAEAHVGFHADGLVSGIAHPMTGADHLLTMVAVGFWAASLGGKARLAVPASFLGLLVAGALLAVSGIALPAVEPMIAFSVMALGLLVALDIRLPVPAASALVGFAALFHGHAHGSELPAMGSPSLYFAGFLAATALLHAMGLGLGALKFGRIGRIAMRVSGAGLVMAGTAFLAG